ncbi:ABC transporter substrate-binding protein [Streptomyces sp. 6N223]|uniref:ABC transporter substrate-binding protein n=1 Tax=Streptomyces sp. 6N223 TaxID=3457412 RepID=UPI003FD513B4
MRAIRVKAITGIGLAVALVVGAIGGWMMFGSGDGDEEPIVVGTTTTPTTADPAGTYDAGGWALVNNLFQSLLTFPPGEQVPVPDAAERCDFDDDRLTVYRCTLRSGLTFNNGDPVTPEDVQFSYDRILAMAQRAEAEAADDSLPEEEKFSYAGPAPLLSGLEEVRVDGQDIVFELARPNATFPFVVASAAGAIVDRDSYERTEPRTDGRVVGSGPFVMTSFDPEGITELEPNPDYEGAAPAPEQPVTIRYFSDAGDGTANEALARAWEAGEIDVNAGSMGPDAMAEVLAGKTHGDQTYESTGADIRVMAFNTDEGRGMSNPVARRVAASLLDREQITHHVFHDTVEALYSLVPAGFPGHGTPYFDAYAGNAEAGPDALRQELLDAGLPVPVPFELAFARGAASGEEARLIEEQLEADGLFEVELRDYEWSELLRVTYSSRDFDAYIIGWVPDFPDPATFTDLLGPADGLATGFGDPEIDDLLGQSQAEPDRGLASEFFKTINELAAAEAPIIPLWQSKTITIADLTIGGVERLSDGSGMWRLWELYRI